MVMRMAFEETSNAEGKVGSMPALMTAENIVDGRVIVDGVHANRREHGLE